MWNGSILRSQQELPSSAAPMERPWRRNHCFHTCQVTVREVCLGWKAPHTFWYYFYCQTGSLVHKTVFSVLEGDCHSLQTCSDFQGHSRLELSFLHWLHWSLCTDFQSSLSLRVLICFVVLGIKIKMGTLHILSSCPALSYSLVLSLTDFWQDTLGC